MKALIDHRNVTELKVVASCGAAENIVKESTRTACYAKLFAPGPLPVGNQVPITVTMRNSSRTSVFSSVPVPSLGKWTSLRVRDFVADSSVWFLIHRIESARTRVRVDGGESI